MLEMQVVAIGLDAQRGTPLLLVAEQGGRHRALPVSIGAAEAAAIHVALRGEQSSRPPTHQLIVEIIAALGSQLDHVEITAMHDSIFHADLVFADRVRISARPSDAVALALHAEIPIRAPEELLDLVGTTAFVVDRTDADPDETEVAKFRSELEHLDPDDFTFG